MTAGTAYTPIATYTVSGSSTASYTFTSIPSTYTDLVLICMGSTTNGLQLQFNSDTGTNYSATGLYGNGSAASTGSISNKTYLALDGGAGGANAYTPYTVNISNYSNSNIYKTVLTRFNATTTYMGVNVGLWRGTSAINAIKVYQFSGNLTDQTTFTLYGITAA